MPIQFGYKNSWLTIQAPSAESVVWLYHVPGGLATTPDGYVSGPPEALEYVRFGDGWALYDLTDLPERLSPERVAAALNPKRSEARGRR